MATASEQLKQAQTLLQEKRYQEAYQLLKTVDHPKAKEWLGKLEEKYNIQPVSAPPKAASPVSKPQNTTQPPVAPDISDWSPHTCPNCGKDDRTTMVSAIVGAGTVTTQARATTNYRRTQLGVFREVLPFASSQTLVQATSSTALAQQLNPRIQHSPLAYGIGCLFFPLGCVGSFFICAGLSGLNSQNFMGGVITTILGLLLFGAIWGLRQLPPLVRERAQKQRAVQRWMQSHYCERCGVVYIEREPYVAPPMGIGELLYRETAKVKTV